ncbi:peptidase [Actinorhabdospora filicis]|uniref:Peptidase n=1 Tax=Actinorhabdospora filicis TaxID=1785913 RepID=A0A9W6WAF8_9ACTN|nr:serine hydrolase domain-containing protein [Actinorhabdospora filicis]GLZ77600.1 peptidase [Actinorhabdospora filicis]
MTKHMTIIKKRALRAIGVTLTVTAAVGYSLGLADPASAAEPGLRPVNKAGLERVIAGLPSGIATYAQVRVDDADDAQDWAGASGVLNRRSGEPSTVDAKFRIGSVTKVFNAAIVLQLVDEGRLSLDDTVQRLLPGLLPRAYEPVTVGQLLNFTSGLPSMDIPGSDEFAWQYAHRFDHWEPRDYVRASVRGKAMHSVPGEKQEYKNIDTVLSGLVIEKVTGSTWEKQVQKRIAKPLGLKDTYAVGESVGIKGVHQRGYQLVDGKNGPEYVDVTVWDQSSTWASGDMVSTTADLAVFIRALFAGDVVKGDALEHMFQVPAVPVYDGDTDPANDKPATRSMGLKRDVLPDNTVVWGKTGARPGYVNGVGATRDGARVLVYSIGSTDAKGGEQSPLMMPIIACAMGLM